MASGGIPPKPLIKGVLTGVPERLATPEESIKMIPERPALESVLVIGIGRMGSAISTELAGRAVPVSIWSGRRAGRGELPHFELKRSSLLLIAVADDAIQSVAGRLAEFLGEAGAAPVALHLSGVLDASALQPLHLAGCAIGSCHPFQTFPSSSSISKPFEGVTFGVEGEPAARQAGQLLAERLGGRAVEIAHGRKALYHLAAVLSGNGIVALLAAARDALCGAGWSGDEALRTLGPLARTSLDGALSAGPEQALSGPVSRGDEATLDRHRAALVRWDAERIPLYEALVREQRRLVVAAGDAKVRPTGS